MADFILILQQIGWEKHAEQTCKKTKIITFSSYTQLNCPWLYPQMLPGWFHPPGNLTFISMLPTLVVDRMIGRPTMAGKMWSGKLDPAKPHLTNCRGMWEENIWSGRVWIQWIQFSFSCAIWNQEVVCMALNQCCMHTDFTPVLSPFVRIISVRKSVALSLIWH